MKWRPYPKYKPSGVEWLGDVPEGWAVKRLKYLATINDETLPETTNPDFEFSYVDIGSVDPVKGIVAVEKKIFETAPSRARRIVRMGDTIVSTVRTYLRAIAPIQTKQDSMIVSTGFAVVRPHTINQGFMSYALREAGFIDAIVARSVGVSYPAVNASEIGTIPVPLPNTDEQTAIVDFLDREAGRIDILVAKKQTLIERLKEKRAALISRTVTRGLPPDEARKAGLDPHPRLKPSGVEWLGDVPAHWDIWKLAHLAKLKSGENITSEQLEDDGIYPVFGGNGLRGYSSRYTHSGHYVLIGRQGALCGNINYANGEFWASEHAIVVEPYLKVSTIWLGELLRSMNLNQYSISAAQPGLSVETISALRIPVPPLAEQTAIADFLDRETTKIDKLIAKIETAIERLREYRTALITAAVTGKIDVREEAKTMIEKGQS